MAIFWISPISPVAAQQKSPAYLPAADFTRAAAGVAARLDAIHALASDGHLEEAVDALMQLMGDDGDALLAFEHAADEQGRRRTSTDSFVRHEPLRDACQNALTRIAHASPEALQIYRRRVDPLARQWYEQGAAANDGALLEKLARRMFLSSYGDDAALLLGEMALERGEYTAARRHWERLHGALRAPATARGPAPPGTMPLWLALRPLGGSDFEQRWGALARSLVAAHPPRLVYPDTNIALSDIRARLVLVSILQGHRERARIELEVMRRLHGEVEGLIGGRAGRYVDLLTAQLETSSHWRAPVGNGVWKTFAGSPRRAGLSRRGGLQENRGAAREAAFVPRVSWRLPWAPVAASDEYWSGQRQRVAEEADQLLSRHLAMAPSGLICLCDAQRVQVFSLASGRAAWRAGDDEHEGLIYDAGGPAADNLAVGSVGAPRFTLTIDEGRLFAKLGSSRTTAAEADDPSLGPGNAIYGFDLQAQGRLLAGFPLSPPHRAWSFDGAPLCSGRRLVTAIRRKEGVRTAIDVVCYDTSNGSLLWRRPICAAEPPGAARLMHMSHTLLTLGDKTVYVNTNLGVVASLDMRDGRLLWLTSYPRDSGRDSISGPVGRVFRDLNPCMLHRGLIIAAPNDCSRIFALDAASGEVVWITRPRRAADVVHLLGVGEETLLASGDVLYWIDLHTGRLRGQFPGPRSKTVGAAPAEPRGYGRGVLADGRVWWPTRERIFVFEADRVRMTRQPIELSRLGVTGGNLLFSGNLLLCATATELVALGAAPDDAAKTKPRELKAESE